MVTHVHLQLLYGATVEMHSRYSAYMAVETHAGLVQM